MIVGFLMSIISCSKDDDLEIEPKVENPNYLKDVAGRFDIKSGFYFMKTGILGSPYTSYVFSAQENNIWISLDWEVPDGSPQTGTFNISNCLYINPNEGFFTQEVREDTITIDKIEQTDISDQSVRYILVEGSYAFSARKYDSLMGKAGKFHYEGKSDFYR